MNGTLSQMLGGMSAVSALTLGIGLACLLRKQAARFTCFCFLIAGIGIAGWVGVLLKSSMEQLNQIFTRIGQSLIGASAALVVGGFLLTWLLHDLRKKGKVSKIAPYLALIVPSFIPLFLAALATIPALRDASHGVSALFTAMKG
jgi:hypothetical protein